MGKPNANTRDITSSAGSRVVVLARLHTNCDFRLNGETFKSLFAVALARTRALFELGNPENIYTLRCINHAPSSVINSTSCSPGCVTAGVVLVATTTRVI